MGTLFCGIQTVGSKWDRRCQDTRCGSQLSAGSHITGECNGRRIGATGHHGSWSYCGCMAEFFLKLWHRVGVVVIAVLRLHCHQLKNLVHFVLEAGWTISTVQRVGSLELCSACHLWYFFSITIVLDMRQHMNSSPQHFFRAHTTIGQFSVSSWCRGFWLDELQELQFWRKLKRQSCVNKITIFFIFGCFFISVNPAAVRCSFLWVTFF